MKDAGFCEGIAQVTARLVMWDIDHTLVDTRGVGRDLFATAFQRTTGRRMLRQAAIDGMTDPVIFRDTAQLHDLTATRDDFAKFAVALGEAHLSASSQLRERGHALPGAASTLAALAAIPGVRQAPVTGNIRASAEVKLRVFGLDTVMDLEIGAYGEDADTRPGLVQAALRRASEAIGHHVNPSQVTLVGDTPADIAGALAHGLRAVGVATGRSSEGDLLAAGATAVLPDLSHPEQLVDLVCGIGP